MILPEPTQLKSGEEKLNKRLDRVDKKLSGTNSHLSDVNAHLVDKSRNKVRSVIKYVSKNPPILDKNLLSRTEACPIVSSMHKKSE